MADELLKLVAVLALILINGVFVAAEFSLFGIQRTQVDQLASTGNWSARAVRRSLDAPHRFISACQIGITVSSLALGWLTEPAIAHLIEPALQDLLGDNAIVGAHVIAAIIALFLVTDRKSVV